MKYLTTMKHKYVYRANWTDFTSGGANASERVYNPSVTGTINFAGGIGPGDNLVVYSPTPLRLFVRVDSIVDKNGVLLLPWETQAQGATYEVRSCQPMLNVHGVTEGYRMNWTRI